MKIILLCVGAMHDAPLATLVERYSKRINFYMPAEIVALPDIKASKNLPTEQQCIKEGEMILSKISTSDYVVLFDELGKEMTSREFSQFIEKKASTLSRNLIFVIGGPFGFSKAVYDRADYKMALSKMTFTHEMARVLASEQLYRALSILNGSSYHHD